MATPNNAKKRVKSLQGIDTVKGRVHYVHISAFIQATVRTVPTVAILAIRRIAVVVVVLFLTQKRRPNTIRLRVPNIATPIK